MTKNRKMFNALKDAGFSEKDVMNFCEAYLELVLKSYTEKGVNPTDLAEKMLRDKLVYKGNNGKLYVEK